jgi:hypothetical protein
VGRLHLGTIFVSEALTSRQKDPRIALADMAWLTVIMDWRRGMGELSRDFDEFPVLH